MARLVMCMIAAGLLAGLCGGCAQEKFTRVRYDTINNGMSAFDVETTLGTPVHKFSDSWTYWHEEPFYKAVIKFHDGRVIDKAWYDSKEMGEHPDTKPPVGGKSSGTGVKTGTVVE